MINKICIFMLLILVCGCAKEVTSAAKTNGAEATSKLTEIPELAGYSLGDPIEKDNMAIVPVISKKHVIEEQYASLAEAKKYGWIEIEEMPGREEVNHLQVSNSGDKAILLLGGELLLGGKQDRMVAKDTLVYPGQTVVVNVFCVEHGRWSGSYGKFDSGEKMVPLSVRKAAQQSQQGVWSEVDKFNTANGVVGGSTTVDKGMNSTQLQEALAQIRPELERQLLARDDIVGMVFLVNGKIETFEIFGNNALFRQSLNPLLTSFIAQANTSPKSGGAPVSIEDCAKFISSSLNAPKQKESGGMSVLADQEVQGYELKDARQRRDGDSRAAVPLHGTYQNNDR